MSGQCRFQQCEQGWVCAKCGFVYRVHSELPPERNCTIGTSRSLPSLQKRVVRWGVAVVEWQKSGRPRRSDEEVEQLFSQHCSVCDRLVAGRCSECGCNVNKSKIAVLNKIRMATEHCPIGKW